MKMLIPNVYSNRNWPTRTLASSLLDEFFNDFDLSTPASHHGSLSAQHSISETETHYFLKFDVPGVNKDDLNIDVKKGVLTVSGERRFELNEAGGEKSLKIGHGYGNFSNSFTLPDRVNSTKIEANLENGVLILAIPKREKEKGQRIEIQSGKSSLFKRLLGGKSQSDTEKKSEAS